MRLLGSLFLCAFMAAAAPAVRSDMLVTTAWLAQHLQDPNLVILAVSRDRATYNAGHIPGARFVALSEIIVTRNGILNELPPAAALQAVFERAGVSDDTRVILYGDDSVLPATRAYFTLDYLGHDATALLNGGLPKWKAEGLPVTTNTPNPEPGHLTPRPRPQVVVDINAVKDLSYAASNAPKASPELVDARTDKEFTGATPASSEIPRPGHIPGAVDVYWMQGQASKTDMSLLPEAQLRQMYESAGVTPDRPVVTYCNTGMQASQSYFTLKYLGYDAHMYDGSFSEWSHVPDDAVQQ